MLLEFTCRCNVHYRENGFQFLYFLPTGQKNIFLNKS